MALEDSLVSSASTHPSSPTRTVQGPPLSPWWGLWASNLPGRNETRPHLSLQALLFSQPALLPVCRGAGMAHPSRVLQGTGLHPHSHSHHKTPAKGMAEPSVSSRCWCPNKRHTAPGSQSCCLRRWVPNRQQCRTDLGHTGRWS